MNFGYIFISHPDGRQQAIPLRAGVLQIGSAPDNDLVLAGAGIAPRHATIRCDDEGDLLITVGGRDTRSSAAAMEIELPRAFATAMLARIGGYALRYQPAVRPSYTQLQADAPPDDQATLLHALLDQRIVWADAQQGQAEPHEAITIEMQALRGVALGE
jgi:FHA domain-containing protein